MIEGTTVGCNVGGSDGLMVGNVVGNDEVGLILGEVVGIFVVGLIDGNNVGSELG